MTRTRTVLCSYCDGRAKLVTGADLYPGSKSRELAGKLFWECAPCRAWVGCHPPAKADGRGGQGNGDVPLGRLANAELRRAKQQAHAAFDPIWRDGAMSRQGAYAWLAGKLGIPNKQCHIGAFDVDRCQATVRACLQRQLEGMGLHTTTTSESRAL